MRLNEDSRKIDPEILLGSARAPFPVKFREEGKEVLRLIGARSRNEGH